jgi:hypothetical protein
MDNMYQPGTDGGYPADATPSSPHPRTRWFRWGAGLTLAGFLVGGGITLAVVSGGTTASASPASSTVSSAAAAQLNTALTDAGGTSAVPRARVRRALGRIRHLGGVEGNVTFRNKKGFHPLSFERGTIQSVTGSDVVIKSPDGTTWAWKIVSDTVVRKNGAKTTTSALSAGEKAFAAGPVASGARDARLIIVRPRRA